MITVNASVWGTILGGLAALVCLGLSLKYLRRKRLIDDLPTSKAQGVFIGQCELAGTAESDSPFTSYLSGGRCVLYNWTVSEHWSRTTVHMTSKGPQVRHESGWKEVAKGGQSAPFYLKDDTGLVRVVPDGAELHPPPSWTRSAAPRTHCITARVLCGRWMTATTAAASMRLLYPCTPSYT